jgi:hypothetical protein
MSIRDHFSESLEKLFWVTNTHPRNSVTRIRSRDLFDPGSGMEKFGSWIQSKHHGSAALITTSNYVRNITRL